MSNERKPLTVDDIGYLFEPEEDYRTDLKACRSLEELRTALQKWELIAGDALDATNAMTEEDYPDYQQATEKEEKGVFAGQKNFDRFSNIWMPATMLKARIVAMRFGVPWGTTFIRSMEVGKISIDNGRAAVK